MDEQTQYENMLGVNEQTSTITKKPLKRKRVKKQDFEQVKNELVEKVNSSIIEENNNLTESELVKQEIPTSSVIVKPKKKFKFSVIGTQIAVIFLLVLAITITSLTFENSGINTVIKGIFGDATSSVDNRIYNDFKPVFTLNSDVSYSVKNGIIELEGKGSVYSPCNGLVTSVMKNESGLYDIEVTYSENFKAKFYNLKYAYTISGQSALSKVPIGYFDGENCTVCFSGTNDETLTSYTIVDNAIVWEV